MSPPPNNPGNGNGGGPPPWAGPPDHVVEDDDGTVRVGPDPTEALEQEAQQRLDAQDFEAMPEWAKALYARQERILQLLEGNP